MFIDYTKMQLKHWLSLILSLFSIFYAYVSFNQIKYGMDLQGGVCVTFAIKEDDIKTKLNADLAIDVKQTLAERKIPAMISHNTEAVFVEFINQDNQGKVYLKNHNWVVTNTENGILVNYTAEYEKQQRATMFNRIYSVIRHRSDEHGTGGVAVYASGSDRVVVEVPGATNPEELKSRLGSTGRLTFKINGLDSDECTIDGSLVESAQVHIDNFGAPTIGIKMSKKGAIVMQDATKNNVGKVMSIFLADSYGERTISSATIQDVLGREFQITGIRSAEEAQEIALVIRSGALPVALEVVEERLVGAEMGSDAAYTGIIACIFAILLVIAIMIGIYGYLGIIASMAVLINLAMLSIFIALTGYNMTLSGIAGVALSVGMAVDANVLINENLRHSLAEGKSWIITVRDGYYKALRTIWDSNLTTLIAAWILYAAGSGIIRGFAVIFAVGLIISFFTSVVLTKGMMEVMNGDGIYVPAFDGPQRLFSYVTRGVTLCGLRKFATLVSLICIMCIGIASVRNGITWGVDFAGGISMEIKSDLGIHELRQRIDGLASVQESGEGSFLLKTDSIEKLNLIKSELSHSAQVIKMDVVGAKLGNELLSTCMKSIVLALACMWLYIAFSFGTVYANIGVTFLIHNLLFILGFYTVFGFEFNEFGIAAMLNTIGYSINDTIVIFDAVRNKISLDGDASMPKIVFDSIKDTLRRTLLTSFTTAAALFMICFGGSMMCSFALPMLFGVVVGTYSSICLAGPYLALFNLKDVEIKD